MTFIKHTLLFITLILLFSCQEKEKAEYDNSFIKNADQLLKDIDAEDNENLKKTMQGFDENSRFTQEFSYIYQDRQLLSRVMTLVDEGKILEAEKAIEAHISVRGLSPEIKLTQDKLKAAVAILSYETNKPYESVAKANAAFLRAQNLGDQHFAELSHYKGWTISEKRLIKKLQKNEDRLIEKSLEFHYDIATVSDRRVNDLIQTQIYSLENSETREDWNNFLAKKDSVNAEYYKTRIYLLNSKLYSKDKTKFMEQNPSSFREALAKVEVLAKDGKTAQFIESISTLNNELPLDKLYFQELMKGFVQSKGWYKAHPINKPTLDLSTLLNTIQKSY